MLHKRRFILVFLCTVLALVSSLASWIQWSNWPDPVKSRIFTDPDAIVILGGGDAGRSAEGERLAHQFHEIPLIVTGDRGEIYGAMRAAGMPQERLLHEEAATSTVENAKFTKPILDRLGAKRVVLVTNWFHAPRAVASFHKFQPSRDFAVSFPPNRYS